MMSPALAAASLGQGLLALLNGNFFGVGGACQRRETSNKPRAKRESL